MARLEGETFSVSYDFSGVEGLVDRVKSVSGKDTADVVVRVPRAATVKVTTVRSDVSVQDVEAPVVGHDGERLGRGCRDLTVRCP